MTSIVHRPTTWVAALIAIAVVLVLLLSGSTGVEFTPGHAIAGPEDLPATAPAHVYEAAVYGESVPDAAVVLPPHVVEEMLAGG